MKPHFAPQRRLRIPVRVARERLRKTPMSEQFSTWAVIPPYLLGKSDAERTAPPYGVNWGVLRNGANAIGCILEINEKTLKALMLEDGFHIAQP